MRTKTILAMLATLLLAFAIGCSENKANSPDVKDMVSKSLDNAGYKDVKVDVDKDKQLVTLSGDVATQDDKDRAEQLAKQSANGFVVSNEIGVRPPGDERAARKIDSNMDAAIEKDFKAVLISNRLENQRIKYTAKNGVLTIKGTVDSPGTRENVEKFCQRSRCAAGGKRIGCEGRQTCP
ncbi:MAG TPA: BON domain-containing protein [Candidatus Angelobacter sp.]|jgi:osmotically-inducible protein OsmY|nr:BON domain-containing protein [Candidatus Angelobacter sp.]